MRWQNPWAWLGLLTLALPILVHLFSRRRARVEPFPSLRFLDVSRLLPTRRTRLSDLPLLLIRLAVVATAVAALAQPLFRVTNRAGTGDASFARVIVLDTSASDSARLADAADRVEASSTAPGNTSRPATTLRLTTDRPSSALRGAIAWLHTQPGLGEVVIVSHFDASTFDSLDLASIPREIGVSLRRVPAATRDARPADAHLGMRWETLRANASASAATTDAVRSAVRSQGAAALLDAPLDASARVVVATSDADSVRTWIPRARPMAEPWMGDLLFALRRDSTLALAAWSQVALTDTAVTPPFVVVRRAANGAPLVLAAAMPGAAMPGADSSTRLLVLSRAAVDAFSTSAVLLAVSRALVPVRAAPSGGVARPNDDDLRRWERTASAPVARALTDTSPDSGPSDGRWVWVLVLALLGLETLVRRRDGDAVARGARFATTPARVTDEH